MNTALVLIAVALLLMAAVYLYKKFFASESADPWGGWR